jgi:hypothetical protein
LRPGLAVDLDLGCLGAVLDAVGGEAELHVLVGGAGREGDGDGVAGGGMVVKVLSLVEPRMDSVWVRVFHAEGGGRVMVTDPRVWLEPRLTVIVLGQAPLLASQ